MAKRKPGKKPNYPPNVDTSVFIADVPVKITFLHGDETLQEYDDVIDLTFDTKAPAGRELGKRMAILTMREGYSTKNELFKIASDEIHTRAVEEVQKLTHSGLMKHAVGHAIELKVKRNGEITYRMPMKT